jgi:type IV pilus assembly protein PilY1
MQPDNSRRQRRQHSYTASNWEAVSVPASQYQNFANWYAYYRYRNLMARSAMARVFGVIGGKSAANVRVTWQNLGNNSNFNSPTASCR